MQLLNKMHMNYIFHNFRMTIFHDQKTLSLNFIITSVSLHYVSRKIFVEYLFLEYLFVSFDISVLANTVTSQIFIIICLRDFFCYYLCWIFGLLHFLKQWGFCSFVHLQQAFRKQEHLWLSPFLKKLQAATLLNTSSITDD